MPDGADNNTDLLANGSADQDTGDREDAESDADDHDDGIHGRIIIRSYRRSISGTRFSRQQKVEQAIFAQV